MTTQSTKETNVSIYLLNWCEKAFSDVCVTTQTAATWPGPQVEPDEHLPKQRGQRPGVCKLRLHTPRQHLLRVCQQYGEMHPMQKLQPGGRIQSGCMHRLDRHAVPAMPRVRQGHQLLQLQLYVQPAFDMHTVQAPLHNG